ncbi:MAG: ATP-binding cassette domain-containing protein, partial [Nitrospinota bacterium]
AGELSFGQTKLLEFARLLMLDPHLLLLDEPVAGVHPRLITQLENVIQELHGQKTFLIVEHNVTLISRLCDRVVVFNEGRVLTEGSILAVKNDPRVQEAYFG